MRLELRTLALAAALASTAQTGSSQTFYVDCVPHFGDAGLPSVSYAGPRGVPGAWNALPLTDGSHALVDAGGAATFNLTNAVAVEWR